MLDQSLSQTSVLALQRLVGNAAIAQRLAAHEREVQRSAVHQALRSSGRPLDDGTREEMEERMGMDFSDVRVHTDATAHAAAESVQAHAFTSGSHIVFQRGRYDTESAGGKRMLAHELTHVRQQRSGPVAGTDVGSGLQVSDPSDEFERAAEVNAERVMNAPIPVNRSKVRYGTQPVVAGYLQRAPSSYGYSNSDEITTEQWSQSGQSTFSSLIYEDGEGNGIPLGTARSNTSVAHGAEHAEDVVIRTIQDNLTMFAPNQLNKLILTISKTPCTSESRHGLPVTSNKRVGCTERLIELVTRGLRGDQGQYDFQLTILCRGLYAPNIGGVAQAQVLQASQAAVNALEATNRIEVQGDERPAPAARRYGVS